MAPAKKRRLSNWQKVKSLIWPRGRARRAAAVSVMALLALLVVASGILAYADSSHRGEMFPGTTVLGLDVSGMTREEAATLVRGEVAATVLKPVNLVFHERTWTIDPAEMGINVDVEGMVEEAYRAAWGRSWLERGWRRLFDRPMDIRIGLSITMREEALRAKLEQIAAEVDQEPRSASLSFDNTNGKLNYHHSREGRKVNIEASLERLAAALIDPENRAAELAVDISQPSLTDDDVHAVLVVDIMGNTLKWYEKDQLVKTYYVATGEPKYPTPLGKFYIIRKEKNPVWLNPGSEWAKDMPPRIEPGPDNPLGIRALVTSAAGGTVLIHGTKNLTPGLYSHGCIRMANWAIEELFDHVEVGTPLFIWTSRPIPPPPPEEGGPQAPEDPGLGQ